jgi:rare lipoprotein A
MISFLRKAVVLIAVGLALASCSSSGKQQAKQDPFAGKGSPHYPGKGPVPWGGGRYHVGKPYQVAGRWFEPKEQPNYDKKGVASWYGEAFNRRKTSNGEWFEMTRLTAAHPTLPLPSYAKVTNLENGREVVVRLNDRGPFVGTRIIDLSKRTAEVLDFKHKGKAQVRVQYIGPAPVNDNGSHLMAMNKELDRGTPMRKMIASADRRKGKAPVEKVQTAAKKPKKKAAPPPSPSMKPRPMNRKRNRLSRLRRAQPKSLTSSSSAPSPTARTPPARETASPPSGRSSSSSFPVRQAPSIASVSAPSRAAQTLKQP